MSSYRRYNYHAYPTQWQRDALSRLYGACRYAYNWVIDQRELMRSRRGKMQTYVQLSSMFTRLKHSPGTEWLQDMSCVPLQQSIRHADAAYRNFFRLYNAGKTKLVANKSTGGIAARGCRATRAGGTASSPPSSLSPRDSRSSTRTDASGVSSPSRK